MNPPVAVAEPEAVALPEDIVAPLELEVPAAGGRFRIEVGSASTPSEAAAIVAAVEHFLTDVAPASPGPTEGLVNGHAMSAWHRAAIHDAITARQQHQALHHRL